MRPALVLTLFALAATARGQDGPLKSKPEKVTEAEAARHVEAIKKRRAERPFVREVTPKAYMELANGLLANETIIASVVKKYEPFQAEKKFPALTTAGYRDYVIQTCMHFHTAGDEEIKATFANHPADDVLGFEKLTTALKTPDKVAAAAASFDYFFVTVAAADLIPVTVESSPDGATLEIDTVAMTNNTNNVYFVAKGAKHDFKFTLDKHKDREVKGWDPNDKELKVTLTAK